MNALASVPVKVYVKVNSDPKLKFQLLIVRLNLLLVDHAEYVMTAGEMVTTPKF